MTGDLRSRIGDAIDEQHRQGALVGAEVDAVLAVLHEVGREGWANPDDPIIAAWVRPGVLTRSERVLVLPMPEEAEQTGLVAPREPGSLDRGGVWWVGLTVRRRHGSA